MITREQYDAINAHFAELAETTVDELDAYVTLDPRRQSAIAFTMAKNARLRDPGCDLKPSEVDDAFRRRVVLPR